MEGGVAVFLVIVIIAIVAIGAITLYTTGGAITAKSDREQDDAGDEPRPMHKRPTNPTQEKVTYVGTRQDDGDDQR